jgi:predicted  nucleic acid-binding Zn-ribbon protein
MMTEKIQHIINDIRLKSNSLHSQLVSERERAKKLEVELNEVKSQKNALENEKTHLNEHVIKLKSELEAIFKERVDEENSITESRNQDIDDLVREIEHCINQLKK